MDVRKSRCWAEIDMSALVHNLSHLPADPSAVIAVVKADAYGHGVEIVAPILLAEGVRSYGVATVEEGRRLRDVPGFGVGEGVDVYVMPAVLPEEAATLVAHDLIPFVTDWALASALSDAAGMAGAVAKIHIEVDTGIGRAGVGPGDLASFYAACRNLGGVNVSGICTHFTNADDCDGPGDARKQYALFLEALAAIDPDELAKLTLHVANSPAIMRLPDARRHLIRPGLLLYGIGPSAAMQSEGAFGYRPVLSLKARVLLVRRLPAGTDISYSRTYRMPQEASIATIGIGYGDGYPRRLSNIGAVLLPTGQAAPIRGRVCMDQICVELPDDSDVAVGDTVTLIGRAGDSTLRVSDLSEQIGATPHELTTCLTARVPRIGAA